MQFMYIDNKITNGDFQGFKQWEKDSTALQGYATQLHYIISPHFQENISLFINESMQTKKFLSRSFVLKNVRPSHLSKAGSRF